MKLRRKALPLNAIHTLNESLGSLSAAHLAQGANQPSLVFKGSRQDCRGQHWLDSRGGDEHPVQRHEHGRGGSQSKCAEEPRRRDHECGAGPFIVFCVQGVCKVQTGRHQHPKGNHEGRDHVNGAGGVIRVRQNKSSDGRRKFVQCRSPQLEEEKSCNAGSLVGTGRTVQRRSPQLKNVNPCNAEVLSWTRKMRAMHKSAAGRRKFVQCRSPQLEEENSCNAEALSWRKRIRAMQ